MTKYVADRQVPVVNLSVLFSQFYGWKVRVKVNSNTAAYSRLVYGVGSNSVSVF